MHTVKDEHPQQRPGNAVEVIEATKKKWKLPQEVRVVVDACFRQAGEPMVVQAFVPEATVEALKLGARGGAA